MPVYLRSLCETVGRDGNTIGRVSSPAHEDRYLAPLRRSFSRAWREFSERVSFNAPGNLVAVIIPGALFTTFQSRHALLSPGDSVCRLSRALLRGKITTGT